MQVTEQQYEREYANRIRLSQPPNMILDDDDELDKSMISQDGLTKIKPLQDLNLDGVAKNLQDELHAVERENSPSASN